MADSGPANATDTGDLVLVLSDLEHLFNAPQINPRSLGDAEALGVSGVEHLFNLLHFDRQRQRARTLTLLLPPDQARLELADQTARTASLCGTEDRTGAQGVARYLPRRVESGRGRAGAARGLPGVVLVFGSEFTEGMRPLVRKTLENGFEIIGWVLLWRPIEVLGFNPLAIRFRIKAWQSLASVNVVIRAGA